LVFSPGFINDIITASIDSTLSIIYLGISPAGIAYLTWTYALAKMPVSILTSFLAISPFLSIIIACFGLGRYLKPFP
jgi:drug/metabolite transporter (DMT)-like permease